MNMLGFTIAEASRLGMGVDMNNGTGWPFGGPEVSMEDAATRALFREYSLSGGESLTEPVEVAEERQKAVASVEKLMDYSEGGEVLDLNDNVDEKGKLECARRQKLEIDCSFCRKDWTKGEEGSPRR